MPFNLRKLQHDWSLSLLIPWIIIGQKINKWILVIWMKNKDLSKWSVVLLSWRDTLLSLYFVTKNLPPFCSKSWIWFAWLLPNVLSPPNLLLIMTCRFCFPFPCRQIESNGKPNFFLKVFNNLLKQKKSYYIQFSFHNIHTETIKINMWLNVILYPMCFLHIKNNLKSMYEPQATPSWHVFIIYDQDLQLLSPNHDQDLDTRN